MKLPIYLDYYSTTPVDIRIVKKMMSCLTSDGIFGNSSSISHKFGWEAAELVDIARNHIAELIGANSVEIIFTSGATESNNLVIKGISDFFYHKNKHIITSKIEHKSVLNTCLFLEKKGFSVTYVNVLKDGRINIEELKKSIRENTILISIMHVNNEIGSVQDINSIGKICKKNNVFFHVDATQSVGKIPINLKKLNVDFMSFSSHKIYGPKGIGVLYAKNKLKKKLQIQIHGGGHEFGVRSGTIPVHQVVAMGEACKILKQEMFIEMKRIKNFHAIFVEEIKKNNFINLNGDINFILPNVINISFNISNIKNLIFMIKDLAISYGSACNANSLYSSHVLMALGVSKKLINKSIRLSFGRFTTEEEIFFSIKLIKKAIKNLINK